VRTVGQILASAIHRRRVEAEDQRFLRNHPDRWAQGWQYLGNDAAQALAAFRVRREEWPMAMKPPRPRQIAPAGQGLRLVRPPDVPVGSARALPMGGGMRGARSTHRSGRRA